MTASPESIRSEQLEVPSLRPSRPRNIILIGFSFTGKTTVSRLLARRLRWQAVDTDRLITRRTGLTPQQLFESRGEAAFRAVEREVVREVCRGERQVVSTGGGAPIDPESRAAIFDGNLVVLLDASPEVILYRLQHSASGEPRPMLDHPDPLDRIRRLKATREPIYHRAHVMIETARLAPAESADLILRLAGVRG